MKNFQWFNIKIEYLLLVSVLIRFIHIFPLNKLFIAGSDFSVHFFRVWYIAEYGFTNWNYFWYGGYPFLYYYPPLPYFITGFIARVIDSVIAFKLISNIVFLLSPICFFLLVKELGLPKKTIYISTFIFSVFPIYPYYLFKGSFATSFALPFLLLGWAYLMKYLKDSKYRHFLLSSVLFALGFLSHHFSFFIFTGMMLLYFLFSKRKFILKTIKILLTSLVFSIWWLFLMIKNIKYSSSGFAFSIPSLPPLENLLIPQEIFYLLFFILSVLGLYLLKETWKIKNSRGFIIVFLISTILTLFFVYKRPVFFIPIYFSIVLGYSIISKNKIVKPIFITLLFIITTAFFSINSQNYTESVSIPIPENEGRVICLPVGTCLGKTLHLSQVVLPMHGKEVIGGWFPQSQSQKKLGYLKKIYDPLKSSKKDYYNLLREGYVNTIIVRKNTQELVDYFNSSSLFKKIYENQNFVVFVPNEKFSYLELNEKPFYGKIEKNRDMIKIDAFCKEDGILLIKESFHPGWEAKINNKKVGIHENKYGFITLNVSKGSCNILLEFSRFKLL